MRSLDEMINKIFCCDCLDLMKEIPDKSIDLVLTDPPYGNVLKNSGWIHQPNVQVGMAKTKDYTNVDFDLWDMQLSTEYFNDIFRISKNQIIFGANHFISKLPFDSPCWLVWDKDNGDNDFADCELAWTSFKTAVRKFKWRWNGFLVEDPKHKEERFHPTQKPVKLMEWCLKNYSKEGDTILDPFLGSGTTAVACKRLNRNFIGIEKEPKYVEIALKRLEKVNNHKIDEWF